MKSKILKICIYNGYLLIGFKKKYSLDLIHKYEQELNEYLDLKENVFISSCSHLNITFINNVDDKENSNNFSTGDFVEEDHLLRYDLQKQDIDEYNEIIEYLELEFIQEINNEFFEEYEKTKNNINNTN